MTGAERLHAGCSALGDATTRQAQESPNHNTIAAAVSSHPALVMGTLTILVLSLVTPAGLSHRLHHHDARGADER